MTNGSTECMLKQFVTGCFPINNIRLSVISDDTKFFDYQVQKLKTGIQFEMKPESEMRIIPVIFRPILLSLPKIRVRLKSNTIIKLGNYWT